MKNTKGNWMTCLIFLSIIYSLSIGTIIHNKKSFSEEENRFLKPLPHFTLGEVVHKHLTSAYDTYLSDHFIYRNHLIRLKVTTDYLMGKQESNHVYLSKDYLVKNVKDKGKHYSINNIKEIIRFSENAPLRSNIYFMLIPSTCAIQQYKIPKYADTFNQLAFINKTYSQTEEYMSNISIYDDLLSHNKDYIYYRTDHHWTMDGAYIAYKRMAQVMNFEPIPYGDLDIQSLTNDFKGSLHTTSGFDYVKSDEIKAINNENISEFTVYNGEDKTTYDSIYFDEYLSKKDKYSYFLGLNQPKVEIKSHGTTSNRKLLVFKDSYAHSLVPFLSYAYGDITLIDMRYVNTDITKILQLTDYDDILFMYSIDVFLNTKNTAKLSYANY